MARAHSGGLSSKRVSPHNSANKYRRESALGCRLFQVPYFKWRTKKEKGRGKRNYRDPRITNSSAGAWKCVRVCRGEVSRFDRLIFNIYIVCLAVYKGNSVLSKKPPRYLGDNCVCRVNIFTSLSPGSPYFPIALDRNTWNRIHSKRRSVSIRVCRVHFATYSNWKESYKRCFLRNPVNWRRKSTRASICACF